MKRFLYLFLWNRRAYFRDYNFIHRLIIKACYKLRYWKLLTYKQVDRLAKQGFCSNADLYNEFGETIQYGRVGTIEGEYALIGGLKLKQGDRWKETLNPNSGSIKIEKL